MNIRADIPYYAFLRTCLLLVFVFFFSNGFTQQLVEGAVFDYQRKQVAGASVYLNNTTIGTITKDDGSFSLIVPQGNFELIISHIGYKTRKENLNIVNYTEPLRFVLVPETNILDEVVLKPTIYNQEWRNNLAVFKNTFLGRTRLAKTCELLNPKVLHFETDKKTGSLSAVTREPLKIKHKGLGYIIEYDLVDYLLQNRKLTYLGYSKYQELPGGKRKQRRWQKNRRIAYLGSRMHLVRSLRSKKLKEEGYLIDQFKRIPNPNRPKEAQITEARNTIRAHKGVLDLSRPISTPKNALDSAMVIMRKARLPKFNDQFYRKNLQEDDLIFEFDSKIYLKFDNYLAITYTKEKEEPNYINFLSRRRVRGYQRSYINLTAEQVILGPSGEIINPLDYYSEGYWAYEQYADQLPLNYTP